MKKDLIVVGMLVLLSACANEKRELHSGVIVANMDSTVIPGDDFAAFVNGTWMRNTEIPADKSSYGVGRIVHEKSQEDVKIIIEESAAGENAQGSDEQKVGDLYQSYMDREKRDTLGVTPLAPEFEKIASISNMDDLAAYFGYASKYGYGTPMSYIVYADLKEPTKYALYNWQAGLGLPDREYYLAEDEKSVELRAKYVTHIEKMFELVALPNAEESAIMIMDLETKIAKEHLEKEKTRDMMALYNKYPVADLATLMPDFNWRLYFREVGIPELDYLIVTQVEYTKALNSIILETSIEDWKTYLKWHVVNASANELNQEIDNQNFEFYGKAMTGQQEQQPLWRRAVSVVNTSMGEVVGKVYVKKHFPPAAKERMLLLVNNLLKAYEVSIKDLDWMAEDTKVQALDKLSSFTPKVGYPDQWKDYSALTIDVNDIFGNLKRSAAVEHEREMAKVGGPIIKHEWDMTPQTVNAYYSPALNEIVFPAAILQPPFFDMSADDAVNYGGIGAIIGHEIGHGFDDQGNCFDGDGVLRNWWTDQDREEFKKRTSTLIDQYNSFQVFEDLNVNGEFTLGENIGDLGGLTIALKAYKLSLNGKESPVLAGYTGEQRVFLGYAQVWLKKSREEFLRRQVKTDEHSPARFRVNGVVRNIPEFYTAFDVTSENDLYLAPEERVKIW